MCGVAGITGTNDAAAFTIRMLHAMQHRGQETAGIVSREDRCFFSQRAPGLVGDRFANETIARSLHGSAAIGHVRYSTSGSKDGSQVADIQPLLASRIAVAHNGNLTNAGVLRRDLEERHVLFQSDMDTEAILQLIGTADNKKIVKRIKKALSRVVGAYALVFLTRKKLIGVRDPLGIRPLMLGRVGDSYAFASETCAFDAVRGSCVREVRPGEMVVVENGKLSSVQLLKNQPSPRPCIFEHVYFARPDSFIFGQNADVVRENIGRQLALESSVRADIVVPVPDSGVPAADGFAKESGIPFCRGIVRSHYAVGRSFIEPTQELRDLKVRLKLSANASLIAGKSIAVIDDSLVRGTTGRLVVDMVREAGATEVHFIVASPPFAHTCYYGIDVPDEEELVAYGCRGVSEIAEKAKGLIGADSVTYLSQDGLYRAVCGENRNHSMPQFCDACFTGEYPT